MTQTEARGGPRPKPGTLNQLFFDAVAKFDRPDALQVKIGGAYKPISHKQVAERVRHAARGLVSLGVHRGDRVAILSENRPEWAIADHEAESDPEPDSGRMPRPLTHDEG